LNRPSKIIGLSVGAKSLLFAEVSAQGRGRGGEKAAIGQLAEMVYPENVSLATPEQLGQAVAAFLKTQKFGTRDVIIGLPARRLLTRRKDVPPASEQAAAATLRLQAETEFSPAGSDADSFAVDFAGETSSSEATSVLLIATAQSCAAPRAPCPAATAWCWLWPRATRKSSSSTEKIPPSSATSRSPTPARPNRWPPSPVKSAAPSPPSTRTARR
jgi:Tfp pilus assembly PilM family ATPase